VHVHADYDRHSHDIVWDADSGSPPLPGQHERRVVSIHHQAIRTLGRGLRVEARSADDEMIEAVGCEGGPTSSACSGIPSFIRRGQPTARLHADPR
jgi:putative glutamine amidotransferase